MRCHSPSGVLCVCRCQQVLQESQAALAWLEDKRKVQESLAKTDDPLLTAADINKKNETLSRVCHPLMSKPAPKPVRSCSATASCAPCQLAEVQRCRLYSTSGQLCAV